MGGRAWGRVIGTMAVASLLVLPARAGAAAPTFVPIQIDRVDEVDASFCGFAVTAHVVADQTMKIFTDGSGATTGAIATGPWTVTYTTPTRTVKVALTGPAFFDASLTLARGTGRWVVFLPDGSAAFASGDLQLEDTPYGLPLLIDSDGHAVDWCALLAG